MKKNSRYFLVLFSWLAVQVLGVLILAAGFKTFDETIFRAILVIALVLQYAICCGLLAEKLVQILDE